MIRTGVDIVEIERVQRAIARFGPRFLEKIYTSRELEEAGGSIASLAARFAAKEAVSKALGTGIGEVAWREIEIIQGPNRQPILQLHDRADRLASTLGLLEWSVSLSHTRAYAVAFAVAQGVRQEQSRM